MAVGCFISIIGTLIWRAIISAGNPIFDVEYMVIFEGVVKALLVFKVSMSISVQVAVLLMVVIALVILEGS